MFSLDKEMKRFSFTMTGRRRKDCRNIRAATSCELLSTHQDKQRPGQQHWDILGTLPGTGAPSQARTVPGSDPSTTNPSRSKQGWSVLRVQSSCVCPIPGKAQGQAGQGLEGWWKVSLPWQRAEPSLKSLPSQALLCQRQQRSLLPWGGLGEDSGVGSFMEILALSPGRGSRLPSVGSALTGGGGTSLQTYLLPLIIHPGRRSPRRARSLRKQSLSHCMHWANVFIKGSQPDLLSTSAAPKEN